MDRVADRKKYGRVREREGGWKRGAWLESDRESEIWSGGREFRELVKSKGQTINNPATDD